MARPQAEWLEPDPSLLKRLESGMRGTLLTPSSAGYDEARKLHNGMIDRRPAAIARCAGIADVMRALESAMENGLPVSIRIGGHGVPGFAVCDRGIVIDVSEMTAVHVDPRGKTARAQGCELGPVRR